MSREIPARLVHYLPKGHRLWYAKKQGALRHDWLMCICGVGIKLEKVPGDPDPKTGQPTLVTEDLTEERWLEAINQCRMAVHSVKMPCPPITLEGIEQIVRESPAASAPTAPGPVKRKSGRPKKEVAHAA